MGQETREIGELQVKILWERAVLPMCGCAGETGYDLCAAGNYVIPSQGQGSIEIGLAVSLPQCTYTQIAPRSGLSIWNFIDVRVGVVASDDRRKIEVVLFIRSAEDFPIRAGDSIA